MARVKQDLRRDLQAAGFLDSVGSDRIFMTLPESVDAYVRWYVERYGSPPPRVTPPATDPEPGPGRDGPP
jgi:hypothetical protein